MESDDVKKRLPPSSAVTWRYSQRSALHMLKNPEWAIRFFDGNLSLEIVNKSRRFYLVVDDEHSFSGVRPVFIDRDGYQYYYGFSEFSDAVEAFRCQLLLYLSEVCVYGL